MINLTYIFVKGIKLQVTYRPRKDIDETIEKHKNDKDTSELWLAYMDLWNETGAACVPFDIVQAQRKKYFQGVHFRSIQELVRDAKANPGVVV